MDDSSTLVMDLATKIVAALCVGGIPVLISCVPGPGLIFQGFASSHRAMAAGAESVVKLSCLMALPTRLCQVDAQLALVAIVILIPVSLEVRLHVDVCFDVGFHRLFPKA